MQTYEWKDPNSADRQKNKEYKNNCNNLYNCWHLVCGSMNFNWIYIWEAFVHSKVHDMHTFIMMAEILKQFFREKKKEI